MPNSPSQSDESEKCPNIVLAKDTVDLGKVPLYSDQEIIIPISNTGNAPLMISNISVSCDCMVAGTKKMRLEPGEEGAISVNWTVGGRNGRTERTVFIDSNDCDNRRLRFDFTATVYSELEITPEKFVFGDINEKSRMFSKSWKIKIKRVGDEARDADIDISSSSDYLKLENSEPGIWASDVYELKLADDIPNGTYEEEIILRTSIENYSEFRIPVRFRVVPDIRVNPEALFLGFVKADETIEKDIELIGSDIYPIALVSAHSENNAVSTDLIRIGEVNKYKLRLSFGKAFLAEHNNGILLLEIDSQEAAQIRLPFYVHAK